MRPERRDRLRMATDRPHIFTMTRELEPGTLDGHPFWRCIDLFPADSHCFLLDSALADSSQARFSFIGGRPSAVLTAHRLSPAPGSTPDSAARIRLTQWRFPNGRISEAGEINEWQGDPFTALRQLQEQYWPGAGTRSDDDAGMPFSNGLVGFFGYDAGHFLERLPEKAANDLHLPDLAFLAVDEVLALDHHTGRMTVTVTGRGADSDSAQADAKTRADQWPQRLAAHTENPTRKPAVRNHPGQPADNHAGDPPLPVRAHFDREEYCAAVQKCRDHILAGDAFEICLTHRLETDQPGRARDLYQILREINPAPFASYLQFPDFQIVSASPERFLRLDSRRVAQSRPIKGTRPRGATPARDAELRRELSESAKDRAENLMIVDLVRSDLGKVAEIGTVEVPELLIIEEYATVFQMVSCVRAALRPDCDALDLVRACFPGGSMTGAPKIEAMKIIDSIEPVRRGVYSGAIGYLDRSGTMDLSIVIRTIVCKDGRCTFGVGGAVVADSDPAAEYEETLDKAQALIEALNILNARTSAEENTGPSGGNGS